MINFNVSVFPADEIGLTYRNSANEDKKVKLLNTGIAWESDKKHKFKNPSLKEGQSLQQGENSIYM